MLESLPWWPNGPPELAGPGTIHYATDSSWELYDRAGGAASEGTPPFSVFALTTSGVTIALESPRAEGALGFHAAREGWVFAVRTDRPGEIAVVRMDGAGKLLTTHVFEGPSMLHDELIPFALDSRAILVRRPMEIPGGGGGLEVQLGPSFTDDVVAVRWCDLECHHPLALLTRGERLMALLARGGDDHAPIRLGTVTRDGVSAVEALRATDSPLTCENIVLAHDGESARARIPRWHGSSRARDVVIQDARWLPAPNTHPHDLDVCVEDGLLRVRAPHAPWVRVATAVDPEQVWVSCKAGACVAVFARVDGGYSFARFTL